jgi:NAD(P)-dependent dehydrogenase (short-subunit alcohol dehydrogenase family)
LRSAQSASGSTRWRQARSRPACSTARFTGSEEVKANLNAQKRIGQPDEIARAVLYIASGDASFVTGHILSVDGGMSAG